MKYPSPSDDLRKAPLPVLDHANQHCETVKEYDTILSLEGHINRDFCGCSSQVETCDWHQNLYTLSPQANEKKSPCNL